MNSRFVDFKLESLDLSYFVCGTDQLSCNYDLYATVHHMGNLNQGHYYCYAKNIDDNNWYAFNDEKVLLVNKI